jgi:hypothetical protein
VYWANYVEEFLLAVEQSRRYANYEDLKKFWQKRMADFWNESRRVHQTASTVKADYKFMDDKGGRIYQNTKWGEEDLRFLSVDKQEQTYFYVARAVQEGGASRLIDRGELSSYDEIEYRAGQFGIAPKCVLIDCSYERRQVYAAASTRGWTCFAGDDKTEWTHKVEVETPQGKQFLYVKRPYSKLEWGDPGMGSNEKRKQMLPQRPNLFYTRPVYADPTAGMARVYTWSNLVIKDMLAAMRQGRTAVYFGIPEDVGAEYLSHLKAEIRYRKPQPRGGVVYWWSNKGPDGKRHGTPNHFWDCECQIIAAMLIQKLIDVDAWQVDDKSLIAGNQRMPEDDFRKAA